MSFERGIRKTSKHVGSLRTLVFWPLEKTELQQNTLMTYLYLFAESVVAFIAFRHSSGWIDHGFRP